MTNDERPRQEWVECVIKIIESEESLRDAGY